MHSDYVERENLVAQNRGLRGIALVGVGVRTKLDRYTRYKNFVLRFLAPRFCSSKHQSFDQRNRISVSDCNLEAHARKSIRIAIV